MEKELKELYEEYPTSFPYSVDLDCKAGEEEEIWFSRLPRNDNRAGTSYESTYARFFKGNPFDALWHILVVVPPIEKNQLIKFLKKIR